MVVMVVMAEGAGSCIAGSCIVIAGSAAASFRAASVKVQHHHIITIDQ
jgi:hypothetical protein